MDIFAFRYKEGQFMGIQNWRILLLWIPLLFCSLLIGSCNVIDIHPYDCNISGEQEINRRHIQELAGTFGKNVQELAKKWKMSWISAIAIAVILSSFMTGFVVNAETTDIDVWDGTIATGYAGGTGTEEDPYLIATPQQLALMAIGTVYNEGKDGGFKDQYFKLTADISATEALLIGNNVTLDLNGNNFKVNNFLSFGKVI